MKDLLLIPEAQAKNVLTMPEVLSAVRTACIACENGEIYPGDRIVMPLDDKGDRGQWLTAVCKNAPYFGFKFSAVFPNNRQAGLPTDQSTISLFSNKTGEQLALIGANYLTALKTGAAAGVATDLLARKDAHRLGIVGTGVQAFTQLLAMQEVRQLDEVRIFDMSEERMDAFIIKTAPVKNRDYRMIKCHSGDEVAENSDIICTVTPSKTPVFSGGAIQPGAHLNAIGAFSRGMQETAPETVAKAAFAVTEHVDGLWASEVGDIADPLERGVITKDFVRGSLCGLAAGNIAGRSDASEITLYESVGSCVFDVAVAIQVYKKSVKA